MYKVVNDHFLLRLHELFQATSQVHTHDLRDSVDNLFSSFQTTLWGRKT